MSNTITKAAIKQALATAIQRLDDETLLATDEYGCRFFLDRSGQPAFAGISIGDPHDRVRHEYVSHLPTVSCEADPREFPAGTPAEIRAGLLSSVEGWAESLAEEIEQENS